MGTEEGKVPEAAVVPSRLKILPEDPVGGFPNKPAPDN